MAILKYNLRKKNFHIVAILTTLFLSGCVKPYEYQSQDGGNNLVVYGELTTEPSQLTIEIKRAGNFSSNTESGKDYPELDAEVYIEENGIRILDLFDYKNIGRYSTASKEVFGKPGNTYVLFIKTKNGKTYESKPEKMPNPISISNIHEHFVEKDFIDFDGNVAIVSGHQILATIKDPPGENYYLWRWRGIYKISTIRKPPMFPPPGTCVKFCYKLEDSGKEVILLSDRGVNESDFTQPITFIERKGYRFTGSSRYVFTLEQFVISNNTYRFWKGIKDQSNNGTSTHVVPGPIVGNINSTTDDEVVLGAFCLMAKEKRTTIIEGKSKVLAIDKDCHNIPGTVCDPPIEWLQFQSLELFE